MNSKGFTLIELLGVVVLIGLLSGLIIYKVSPSIKDSRESVSLASANNLVKALEDYYFNAKLSGSFNGCSYNFSNNTTSCVGFSFTGGVPSDGVLNLDRDGVIDGLLIFDNYEYSIVANKVFANN